MTASNVLDGRSMANTLEELPIYQKVCEFWDAVTAILTTPALRRDRDLHNQIERAVNSVDANMKEGFEQPTDASFGNFVFIAKGSVAEVVTRARQAKKRGYIDDKQLATMSNSASPSGK